MWLAWHRLHSSGPMQEGMLRIRPQQGRTHASVRVTASTTMGNSGSKHTGQGQSGARLLAFGDSLTEGWTVGGMAFHPYADKLQELMRVHHPGVQVGTPGSIAICPKINHLDDNFWLSEILELTDNYRYLCH